MKSHRKHGMSEDSEMSSITTPTRDLSLSLSLWTLNPLNHHHLGKPTQVLTPKAISWFIHMCPPDLSQISETLQKKLLGYWVTNISDDIKKLSSFFYWTARGLIILVIDLFDHHLHVQSVTPRIFLCLTFLIYIWKNIFRKEYSGVIQYFCYHRRRNIDHPRASNHNTTGYLVTQLSEQRLRLHIFTCSYILHVRYIQLVMINVLGTAPSYMF
jgi:hypothetical protein